MLKEGLVQIYTGDGKGKTTAAFGLALRAAGQGNKVLIYQFLKPPSLDIGERFALELGAVRIRVEALDIEWDMAKSFEDEKLVAQAKVAIKEALERIAETGEKKFYDCIILDEIVFCFSKGLADFIFKSRLHREGKISFDVYWDTVSKICAGHGIPASEYTAIKGFLRSAELEREIDFEGDHARPRRWRHTLPPG